MDLVNAVKEETKLESGLPIIYRPMNVIFNPSYRVESLSTYAQRFYFNTLGVLDEN